MFMQSNGGLAEAAHFRGKDAILSGPAGGVVGMARTSAAAGFDRVIGFDMGGTSTDVSHYAGEFERVFEHAGRRASGCARPMMDIHTVAAGGGSVLHFDGRRYRVGPGLGRARTRDPPATGGGGPLTVTDANVMLGRIQPAHFPRGLRRRTATEPLDDDIVRDRFSRARRARSRDARPATTATPEEVAAGFLEIAVAQHGQRGQEDLRTARPRRHPLRPRPPSAARAASTPARSPTRSASTRCSSRRSPACSPRTASASPTPPPCASSPSRRRWTPTRSPS